MIYLYNDIKCYNHGSGSDLIVVHEQPGINTKPNERLCLGLVIEQDFVNTLMQNVFQLKKTWSKNELEKTIGDRLMKRIISLACLLVLVVVGVLSEVKMPPVANEFMKAFRTVNEYANPEDQLKGHKISKDGGTQRILFDAGWFGVKDNRINEVYLQFGVSEGTPKTMPRRAVAAIGALEAMLKKSTASPEVIYGAFAYDISEALKSLTVEQDLRLVKGEEVKIYETDHFVYYMYNSAKMSEQLGLKNSFTNIILKAK